MKFYPDDCPKCNDNKDWLCCGSVVLWEVSFIVFMASNTLVLYLAEQQSYNLLYVQSVISQILCD